jgi:ABC transporter substrate binding protein
VTGIDKQADRVSHVVPCAMAHSSIVQGNSASGIAANRALPSLSKRARPRTPPSKRPVASMMLDGFVVWDSVGMTGAPHLARCVKSWPVATTAGQGAYDAHFRGVVNRKVTNRDVSLFANRNRDMSTPARHRARDAPSRETALAQWLRGAARGAPAPRSIAPRVARAAIIFNPETAPYARMFLPSMEAAARSAALTLTIAPVSSEAEIEWAIATMGRDQGGGLIVLPDSFLSGRREIVMASAAKQRVPAVYASRPWAAAGGLIAYGIDRSELFRLAASYVDRILKGEKPAELPVQNASTPRQQPRRCPCVRARSSRVFVRVGHTDLTRLRLRPTRHVASRKLDTFAPSPVS